MNSCARTQNVKKNKKSCEKPTAALFLLSKEDDQKERKLKTCKEQEEFSRG